MPIFLGCVWNESTIAIQNNIAAKCVELIKTKTTQPLTVVRADTWLFISALKNSETKEEQILPFVNQDGIAIGRFYGNEKNTLKLIHANYPKIQQSKGKWVVDNCWGRHVLAYFDQQTNTLKLYRDAMGLASLFYWLSDKGLIFSSEISLLNDFREDSNSIDWEYFSSYVSCGEFHTEKTPFKEIKELLPGCCLSYSLESLTVTPFWRPVIPATLPSVNSIAHVFNECVAQWLQNTPVSCLQLSGGLDSTALFFALHANKNEQLQLAFANFINQQASANELIYVQELLKPFDYPLITHEHFLSVDLEPLETWNKPDPAILSLKSMNELLRNIPHCVMVNGHGGDHLFLADINSLFLTDYLLTQGIRGFFKNLKSFSLFNRASSIVYAKRIIKDVLRYFFKINLKEPLAFVSQKCEWFKQDFVAQINTKQFLPPFWKDLQKVCPGKAWHILSAYHSSAAVQFKMANYHQIFPFLSQPLVELALAFPTYETFNDAGTRMHFRKAIAEHYSTNLVWRQSKGEASVISMNLVKNNLKRVQELCLEGQFAKNNLIHKNLLHKHLHLLANGYVDEQWPVLHLLSAEMYLSR